MARFKGRPYPLDVERKYLVKIELAKSGITLSQLAKEIGLNVAQVSPVVSGKRISPITEKKIASYFGKSVEELFPARNLAEIVQMRKLEKERSAA